jgi:transposase-like protein
MSGKRLSKEQKEAIVADLRAGKRSWRAISADHNCSISTVSRTAAELGISSPRKRSKPVEKIDHSYDKTRRIAVLDKMLQSIEDQVSTGGLSSRQLFDLARSARELTTSRRGEDQLPESFASEEGHKGTAGDNEYVKMLLEMPEEHRAHVDKNGVFWDPAWQEEKTTDEFGAPSGLGYDLRTRDGRAIYREFVALDRQLAAEAEAREGNKGITDGS